MKCYWLLNAKRRFLEEPDRTIDQIVTETGFSSIAPFLGSVRNPCGYVMLKCESELSLRKIKK
jgi:transcriptional regulator GlxA family with amidase domain